MTAAPAGSGKVALITGAGNGIGAEVSRQLAGRGWVIAALDLDLAAAEAIAAECGAASAAFEANITDGDSLKAAVNAAVERCGAIDLCFANAGIASTGVLRNTDPDVFAVQADVNLNGTFRTVHACLPHLIESGGYMLINASASALAAPPGLGAYGATKAAVESLGDTLRREVRHLGVDVGVVYVLWVATDLLEGAEREGDTFNAIRSRMPKPLDRTMTPQRVGGVIVRGIEKRARRITAPRAVNALFRLRGIAPTLIERELLKMAPEIERATERDLASGRALGGALRTDTVASAAAAAAARERRGEAGSAG